MPMAWLLAAGLALLAVPARAEPEHPTDQDVRDAIETEYLVDPVVDSGQVAIAVANGVATLTGDVDNLLERRRATRIARVVKGVRSVVDQLRVRPGALRTDDAIRVDVGLALLTDPATESYEVHVAVQDGTVTLTGNVDSWAERRLAETVTMGVRGVLEIRNLLEVEHTGKRPDGEIQAEVESALQQDVLVGAGLIDVSVHEGRVALSGTVGSTAEKTRARIDALLTGAKRVDDSGLQVRPWGRDEHLRRYRTPYRSDDEIRTAVLSALLRDPRVMSFHVEPRIENGTVTLRGNGDNLKARRAAVMDARNTVGVIQVKDHIRVKPPMVDDTDLARRIDAALLRNPIVESYEIDVQVDRGSVSLSGDVDSLYEKSVAEDVVSRVKGVAEVENDLTVPDDHLMLVYEPLVDDVEIHHLGWLRVHPTPVLMNRDELLSDVRDQIFWSPFVSLQDVHVSIENGFVRLTGTVDSWVARLAAVMNAYQAGASWVDDELVVRRTEMPQEEAGEAAEASPGA